MSADFIWRLWNKEYGLTQDNFYSNLLHTSRNLLDFKTPQGFHLNFTSLPSTTFANSHRLTVFPNIGGSLSFLHSSRPFSGYLSTRQVSLLDVLEGYEQTQDIGDLDISESNGLSGDIRNTLMFGRLHLPGSKLEAIYARRLCLTRQLILTALSSPDLPNRGTIFAQLQQDYGTHTHEFIYNTDDAMFGFRYMRQLGGLATSSSGASDATEHDVNDTVEQESGDLLSELPYAQGRADLPLSAYGRFAAGFECYYGALHKSAGLSFGMRFATLPYYHGHPRTMTVTVNPLVGHFSSTYTMKASGMATLCSRLDFNIFSYESDLTLGAELWHYPSVRSVLGFGPETKKYSNDRIGFEAFAKDTIESDAAASLLKPAGVIKIYLHSTNLLGGLLWEGRIKDFLISFGGKFNLQDRTLGTLGVEVLYGS